MKRKQRYDITCAIVVYRSVTTTFHCRIGTTLTQKVIVAYFTFGSGGLGAGLM